MRRMISTRQGMMASRASADDKNNNNTHLFYVLSVDKLKRFLLNLRYFLLEIKFCCCCCRILGIQRGNLSYQVTVETNKFLCFLTM